MQNPLKPKQLAKPNMRDKKDRYKAFNKFKDVSHKCFGPSSSCGYGKGQKIICSVCGKEVSKGVYKEGKWYCKEC